MLSAHAKLGGQRDHVLGKPHREKDGWDDELLADANRTKDELGEEDSAFTSLGASAELDQVIYDGSSFGTAAFAHKFANSQIRQTRPFRQRSDP